MKAKNFLIYSIVMFVFFVSVVIWGRTVALFVTGFSTVILAAITFHLFQKEKKAKKDDTVPY